MQQVISSFFSPRIRALVNLTKPGIILGNLFTAIAGFFIAYDKKASFSLLFFMVLGLSCVIASACAFNNYIDRALDTKMQRTQNRALPQNKISPKLALLWGAFLGFYGVFILLHYTNPLSTVIALLGWVVYVLVYSFLKYYFSIATLIGSIAGACPPLVGYVVVKEEIDITSLLLFFLLVTWQMPHFLAIAIYRKSDYEKANIPLSFLQKGLFYTQVEILLYSVAFVIILMLLYGLQKIHGSYFWVSFSLGLYWIYQIGRGFYGQKATLWAKKVFYLSLVVILAISLLSPLNLG